MPVVSINKKRQSDIGLVDVDILRGSSTACLLYTSDAADERSSVDLGGRRIIKKKTPDNYTQPTQPDTLTSTAVTVNRRCSKVHSIR